MQSYQKPHILKDPTTIALNYHNNPRHQFIVNGGVIGQSTTLRPPLFKSSAPQLPIYVGNKNHNSHINHNPIYENPMTNVTELHAIVLNSHPQQMANNNQYVTPVLDLVVPQPQYQQIDNHYNVGVSIIPLCYFILNACAFSFKVANCEKKKIRESEWPYG